MRTYAFIQAAQTLGGAAGRTYQLPNEAAAMVGCTHVVLVTTATINNRALVLRFLDASNNVLFESQSVNVGPSLTSRQNWGAGMVSGTAGILRAERHAGHERATWRAGQYLRREQRRCQRHDCNHRHAGRSPVDRTTEL